MRSSIPLIFVASCIESFGDYHLKKYAMRGKERDLMLGLAGYGAMIYTLIQVWKIDKLSVSNVIWNSFSTITNGFVGLVLLDEKPTPEEWVGAGLSAAGIAAMAQVEASPQ